MASAYAFNSFSFPFKKAETKSISEWPRRLCLLSLVSSLWSASAMSWTEQPIFFVDFEGSRASGILEFGVAEVLGGKIVSVHTRLCRATGQVRAEDMAVHGLQAEALAAHAPFADEWDYFAGLRERGPLAAHYAGVENALLHRPSSRFHAEGVGVTYQLDPQTRTVRVSDLRQEPTPRARR